MADLELTSNVNTLICVDDLTALDEDVRIFDVRSSLNDHNYGRNAYQAGHIPMAIFANLETDLSGPVIKGETGRHPLPSRSDFEQCVRTWGINNTDHVVVYDDGPGAFAARLWWMFRWLGHHKVSVLDGGLRAWLAANHTLTETEPTFPRSGFEAKTPITRLIEATEIPHFDGIVTDARDYPRFTGEVEPIDPVAGHIPNAISLPFQLNLDEEGFFKDPDTLKRQFHEANISTSERIACYCGSGVTAAHNILALLHTGHIEPYLYAGSWSEWIVDPKRPIATHSTHEQ